MKGKTQQTFLAVFSKSLKPQSIHHIISVQNLDGKKVVSSSCCVIWEQNVVLLMNKANVY